MLFKPNDNLFNEVLIKPALEGYDQLKVITGYSSPSLVYKHIEELSKIMTPHGVKIDLIVGMIAQGGIGFLNHNSFVKLDTDHTNFRCRYVISNPAVHSKMYLWENSKTGKKLAYVGSANYSVNGMSGGQEELLATASDELAQMYWERVEDRSLSVFDYIEKETVSDVFQSFKVGNEVRLTLLSTKKPNEIHLRSGLNWGQRDGREPNQAYIPVPSSIAKSGFFPSRSEPFMLHTDDGESFGVKIAQDNDKAIETYENNSILGRYFRKRLGLEPGSFVTAEDLHRYGRTDVSIKKIDGENYLMDFSV